MKAAAWLMQQYAHWFPWKQVGVLLKKKLRFKYFETYSEKLL